MLVRHDDPLAHEVVRAIQTGNVESLQRLLRANPGLASARVAGPDGASKTLLHLATDWPGYFPNGPAVVRVLIAGGAEPNAPVEGMWHAETPLHWTASTDDVEVAAALIDGSAHVEATGASIGGGTPLDNAVGYGCWRVARLLVERGAKVERLWLAAALGMTSRVTQFFTAPESPTPREINDAFWQACHGGHRRTAEYLLARGADVDWVPEYTRSTPLSIASTIETGREALVHWLREQSAASEHRRPTWS